MDPAFLVAQAILEYLVVLNLLGSQDFLAVLGAQENPLTHSLRELQARQRLSLVSVHQQPMLATRSLTAAKEAASFPERKA